MKTKKYIIILACCVLAAALILGITGVINLSGTTTFPKEDELIGGILTLNYPSSPYYSPGGITHGKLVEQDNRSGDDRTIPADYDYDFGMEGYRIFNQARDISSIDTRLADPEFCEVSSSYFYRENTDNGVESLEKELGIDGTLYFALQKDEYALCFSGIYRTADGEVYVRDPDSASLVTTESTGYTSNTGFSLSASQHWTDEEGKSTTEIRTTNVKVCFVNKPVKITLYQFNAAHELIRTDEYEPGTVPQDISPLPETEMLLVDTLTVTLDGQEPHTYETCGRETDSFHTLRCREDGICRQYNHKILW